MTSAILRDYGPLMRRNIFIGLGSLAALGSAFVATTHCCERLNFLATMGLLQPG